MLGGWVVGVWCLRYCPCSCGCWRFWVLARVCLGWWGASVSRRPTLPRLACLLACVLTPLVWALLACAGFCAAGATVMGRDMIVPPHTAWRCPRCVACKRRVGVLSWCANTRARTQREREGEGGGGGGRTVVAWLGAVGGAGIPCWRAVPTRGRAKLTLLGRGRGALPAVVGFWQWGRVVVGCAWWCWGRGAFPLVVGWVGGNDFPLVASRGWGWLVVGFGCGR